MGVLFQIIGTFLLCFSAVNMGIIAAWPSSTVLLFKSENSTLSRPMTDMEISLFGSLPAFGALVANPVAAVLLDRLGRRHTAIITTLFYVIAWSMIAITEKVEVILIATVISGLGGAIALQVAIYISEIAQDSIRGTMTAGLNQFYGIGCLVSYFLGGTLKYHAMVYTCLSLAVVGVLMIAVLKESPLTLMAKGREEEAAQSIAFYRGIKSTAKEVSAELNNIRRSLKPKSDDIQCLTRVKEILEPELETKKLTCWQFFKSTSSTRREFFLVLILKLAYVYQGMPVLQVYAEPMFAAAVGDVISPNLCSVMLGLVVLLTGFAAAYLIDVLGRRPLLVYSSVAAGICCAVLGTQILTELLPKWTIPLFIYMYAITYTIGAGTVPFVVLAEVFLPEVKSILSMLAVEWTWIWYFFALFFFNLVTDSFGLAPVFFLFSFTCIGTSIFFFYFLPETKGLPVYAIQLLFTKNAKK